MDWDKVFIPKFWGWSREAIANEVEERTAEEIPEDVWTDAICQQFVEEHGDMVNMLIHKEVLFDYDKGLDMLCRRFADIVLGKC